MSKYGNLGLARQECSLPLMNLQRDCSLTGQGLLGRRGTTQQQQRLPQAWGAPWKSDGETGREPKQKSWIPTWCCSRGPTCTAPPSKCWQQPWRQAAPLWSTGLQCLLTSPLVSGCAAERQGDLCYCNAPSNLMRTPVLETKISWTNTY